MHIVCILTVWLSDFVRVNKIRSSAQISHTMKEPIRPQLLPVNKPITSLQYAAVHFRKHLVQTEQRYCF